MVGCERNRYRCVVRWAETLRTDTAETHAGYVCGRLGTVNGVMRVISTRGFKADADIKRERYYP
jgi:hypothetical protein